MIAHFALMGDLYQYDPYDTEASLWNSYPWQIGADNGLNFKSIVPAFTMSKTIWDIDDSDSSIGAIGAEFGEFSMFATLILMDNWGNLGSDIQTKPAPSPLPFKLVSVISGQVISASSLLKLIVEDANSERQDEPVKTIAVLSGQVISASSLLKLIVEDANSERQDEPVKTIAVLSGQVISIASIQP
jgi:hypothetical protein